MPTNFADWRSKPNVLSPDQILNVEMQDARARGDTENVGYLKTEMESQNVPATFKVKAPDGSIINVNAPPGATEEQAIEFAAATWKPQKAAPLPQKAEATNGTYAGEGILRGIYDPFTGLAQGAYNLLPKKVQETGDKLNDYLADKTGLLPKIGPKGFNQAIADNEADYAKRQGGGLDVQRITGNVLSPVNAALALKAPQAVGLTQRIVQGAGVGGAQSMAQPVTKGDYWQEKSKQGNTGAVVGGALPMVAAPIARLVSPKASVNPDIALLKSKGVNPTIGQTLGGWANTAEQKATSMFGVGDSIKAAREGARNQFNKAVLNDTVESVGGKVDDIGTAGVKQAGDIISRAYDDALSGLKGVTLDQTGKAQLTNLRGMANNMPDQTRKQFNRVLDNIVMKRMSPNQGMTAETFKLVESELGAKAAMYGKSTQASERELGDALLEAQNILRQQAARQNPVYADALSKANQAWAKLVRTEGAAKASSVSDGIFTPGQYLGAIKANSKSVRKRDFSRGTALGQDFAAAGQRVLGNTYPDSGTAGRMLPVLQGAAALAEPMTLSATLGGMASYTPAMQRALVNAASKRSASAPFTAEQIRKLAPVLNPLAIGLLNSGP